MGNSNKSEGVVSGNSDPSRTNDIPNSTEGSTDSLVAAERPRSVERFLPEVGDACLINGALAEITVFDLAANIYSAQEQAGRSINTTTGHISNTRFEALPAGRDVAGLERAQADSRTSADASQETLDEGLSRISASQGNEFTSFDQQFLLTQQPHAGDTQETVVRKIAGEEVETASDRGSVDPHAPADLTDSASVSQHESE